jgi:hypothetical protein
MVTTKPEKRISRKPAARKAALPERLVELRRHIDGGGTLAPAVQKRAIALSWNRLKPTSRETLAGIYVRLATPELDDPRERTEEVPAEKKIQVLAHRIDFVERVITDAATELWETRDSLQAIATLVDKVRYGDVDNGPACLAAIRALGKLSSDSLASIGKALDQADLKLLTDVSDEHLQELEREQGKEAAKEGSAA